MRLESVRLKVLGCLILPIRLSWNKISYVNILVYLRLTKGHHIILLLLIKCCHIVIIIDITRINSSLTAHYILEQNRSCVFIQILHHLWRTIIFHQHRILHLWDHVILPNIGHNGILLITHWVIILHTRTRLIINILRVFLTFEKKSLLCHL